MEGLTFKILRYLKSTTTSGLNIHIINSLM